MKQTTRIVQLVHPTEGRKLAQVEEPSLRILSGTRSVYDLALEAIAQEKNLNAVIQERLTQETLEYDDVYLGLSEWKLLPAFDHPENVMCCMVTGTGLTHKNSALSRQMMHGEAGNAVTDSMQMYQWGVEGGSPEPGMIGVQPEWFYKGNGAVLRAHMQTLECPSYALNGGEEPEIAGIYLVDECGVPYHIGFATGNEFSDHVMETKSYLYLAPSKLRQCALGPELVIGASFAAFAGKVSVTRNNDVLWSSDIHSGEEHMSHNLANLEYHHFKYPAHRVPLQAHVHFFGADAFSFGSQVILEEGDVMSVEWDQLGRPLLNTFAASADQQAPVEIRSLS